MVTKQRIEDESARDLKLAWSVEWMRRQEKLPRLQDLLAKGRKTGSTAQPLAAQRTALAMLSEQYGIPLRLTRLVKRA